MEKTTIIEFKGRITLDVSYDENDIEPTDFFPGDQIEVNLIPIKFSDRVTIKFDNGSFAFNVSRKLFKEIKDV